MTLGLGRTPLCAQRTPLGGAAELLQTLDRLNVLGSALMIAAHPDDENTAVIAYLARGRHLRTAYLSVTRGEGGQNLIGPEQYEGLGMIRTQELLAARRIDGGAQFFTRSFDFGFSKNPEEALQKWGRERALSDLVRVIRRFRPDVIVTRFSPTANSGHGQHTAAGQLAPAAFAAAADSAQFPDQLQQGLQPWRARRLVWNIFAFGRQQEAAAAQAPARMTIDAGRFDFILGKSYAEIAGESRSLHSSQGFGSPERPGPSLHSFAHLAGEPAAADLFDGIDTTWKRVPGAARLADLLSRARREIRPEEPEAILPLLFDAYVEMQRLADPWVERKGAELLHAIQLAAGLWLDAQADRWAAVPATSLGLALTALHRSQFPLVWESAEIRGAAQADLPALNRTLTANRPEQNRLSVAIPPQAAYSQPYWMQQARTGDYYPVKDLSLIGEPENPPVLEATFRLRGPGGVLLPFRTPVRYRWVERVGGEQVRSMQIVPPVSVAFVLPSIIFPEARSRPVVVRVTAIAGPVKGSLSLDLPAGWRATPATAPWRLDDRDQQASVAFQVTPPAEAGGGFAAATAELGGVQVSTGVETIRYPHIPPQTLFPPARVRLERFDARLSVRNIGYVMGAGDEIPQALEQLGATVRLLSPEDLSTGDLSGFDAIVTGVRAVNVRADLVAARQRLLDYVFSGGTVLVQYNTTEGFGPLAATGRSTAQIAPYPLTPSTNRVSVEEALVTFPSPDLPLLRSPNPLSPRDFDGWIQERGLYFMSKWDERYQPVLSCQDPGEAPQLGGTLFARYGKGVFIYTAYSWFRQLPQGVPGAYRIFANLVSAGR